MVSWIRTMFTQKDELATIFCAGFPLEMEQIVKKAVQLIPRKTHRNISSCVTTEEITYLSCNRIIRFPYRMYLLEMDNDLVLKMNDAERLILHCIYSRNCDGYVRQKHVKELLSTNIPEWVIPYIVKVCDEYVVEILQMVYEKLEGKNTDVIRQFCANNKKIFCRSYNRMISYWNEFYREDCYRFDDYVGRKLFIECFGATRTMNCTKEA